MNKVSYFSLILGFALLTTACKSGINSQIKTSASAEHLLENRYKMMMEYPVDSLSMPRSMTIKSNLIKKVPSRDWTSGFFAGNLWQLYRLTGNPDYKKQAEKWTPFSKKESVNRGSHDVGFKVFCAFGEGLKVEKNSDYEKTIIKGAETLCTRFNDKVGAIRSWDFNKEIWDYPVIIDNMMNLELLFEASKLSGNKKYHDIAVNMPIPRSKINLEKTTAVITLLIMIQIQVLSERKQRCRVIMMILFGHAVRPGRFTDLRCLTDIQKIRLISIRQKQLQSFL